jgi:hypothetical protein
MKNGFINHVKTVLYSYYTGFSITRSMDHVTVRMLLCPPLHEYDVSYKHLPLSHGFWSLFCRSTIPYRPAGHYWIFLNMSVCAIVAGQTVVRMCSRIPPSLEWNFVNCSNSRYSQGRIYNCGGPETIKMWKPHQEQQIQIMPTLK